jgi:hypothetical protein
VVAILLIPKKQSKSGTVDLPVQDSSNVNEVKTLREWLTDIFILRPDAAQRVELLVTMEGYDTVSDALDLTPSIMSEIGINPNDQQLILEAIQRAYN